LRSRADVFGVGAIFGVGLDAHRISAPELVEVVDVDRAEIGLQRLEDIRHRDAELARLGTVDVGIKLRHVHAVAGEQAGELRRLRRRAEKRIGRLIERTIAEARAILDLQLETADGAEAHHGRRREHGDEGVADAGIFPVQRHGDGAAAEIGRGAFGERLERDEDDAGIG